MNGEDARHTVLLTRNRRIFGFIYETSKARRAQFTMSENTKDASRSCRWHGRRNGIALDILFSVLIHTSCVTREQTDLARNSNISRQFVKKSLRSLRRASPVKVDIPVG